MVYKVNFNSISVVSSVLLVEETEVHGENRWPVSTHWQPLSHKVLSSTPPWVGFELMLVVINTDCIDSCISIYHEITTIISPISVTLDFAHMCGYTRKSINC